MHAGFTCEKIHYVSKHYESMELFFLHFSRCYQYPTCNSEHAKKTNTTTILCVISCLFILAVLRTKLVTDQHLISILTTYELCGRRLDEIVWCEFQSITFQCINIYLGNAKSNT